MGKGRSAPKSNKRRDVTKRKKGGRRSAVSGMSCDPTTILRMPQAPLFSARSKSMMLPYYSNFSLTVPTTGLAVSYVISANGLYDPDITGTGQQPMGFDQMMVFYEHYTVKAAKIKAIFRNTTTAIAPFVAVSVKADATLVTDPYSIMEQGNTVSTLLGIATVATSFKELTLSVNVKRFLGVDDLMDFESGRGDIANNPAEQLYFHVQAWSIDAAATGPVTVQFRVEYQAVFSEPRVISRSLAQSMTRLVLDEPLSPCEAKRPSQPSRLRRL